MKALSQSEYGELRSLYESVYTPKVDLTEELLDEIFDEMVDEYIEEGYSEEDAIEIVDEAVDLYIDEVLCEVSDSYYDSAVRASKKAAQGIDKAARQKRRAGQVRYAKRKAGEAFKRGKELAGAAKAGASLAKDFAGDELRRAGRKAVHAVTSAPDKAKAAVEKKKQETKRGIKGFIKRQAQKVVNRMSEENIQEIYKGRHGQSDKEYADSRSQGGKMVSGTSKMSGAEYTHGRRVKAANPGMQPDVGGKTKPKSQGKMDRGTRADIEYRKANLKKEELDVFDVVLEFLQAEGYAETLEEAEWMMANIIDKEAIDILLGEDQLDENRRAARAAGGYKDDSKKQPDPSKDGFTGIGNMSIDQIRKMSARIEKGKTKKESFEAWIDEAMSSYDRNRKRAAERAAARNAARDAGKTGVVPGVGYVTPRRERETYVDSAGITRHKSGAKMPKD